MQLTIQPKYYTKTNSYTNEQSPKYITNSSDNIYFKGNDNIRKKNSYVERINEERQKGNWWQKNITWYFGGKRKADEKVNNEIRQELCEQELEKARQQAINKAKQELNNRITNAANSTSMIDCFFNHNFPKGFSKIAGYTEEKQFLIDIIGTPIALERAGHKAVVPNGVLLFGPLGTGKTSLANAFAEQLDCRLVNFRQSLDDAEDMKNLRKEAIEAQKLFEKDGKRTIIQIDCCDTMWTKDSRVVEIFKNFMDNLSEKYHCTIFATANSIEKMDDRLLRAGRFAERVGLAPANKENAKEILKYYAQNFADESINYDLLAEEITKKQDGAFSNARIENIVTKLIKRLVPTNQKITESTLLQSILETGPDITKESLELFKKQLKHI